MDKKDEVKDDVKSNDSKKNKYYLRFNPQVDNEKIDNNIDDLRNDSHVALVDNNDNLRKSFQVSPTSIDKNNEENNNETSRKNSQARLININKDSAARKIDLDNIVRTLPQTNVANKDVSIRKTETNSTVSKSNVKPIYKKQPTKNPDINPQRKPVNGYITTKNENKWGHRIRLRNRFRTGGIKGLTDYEALELLLFYTIEKIDTKSIAYNLINEFGSIEKVFSESYERILAVLQKDIRPSKQECVKSAFLIKFIRSFAILLWKRGIENRLKTKEKIITSGAELLAYLKEQYNNYLETDMKDLSHEQFRVIFLDAKNKILKDEVMFEGTINQTGVYPREILKRALEVNATAIIAVHNHPAGSLKPSNADISVTRTLQTACDSLGISLLDHLIIGNRLCNGDDQEKSFYSFAENGLL